MKKIFIIIMLLSIVVLSGCSNKSENNLNGKYVSIKDNNEYLEIYNDGKCYYHNNSMDIHDCTYYNSNNSIRIEYGEYNVITEKEEHHSQVFEIVGNNLKKSDGTMIYIK